MSLIADGVCVNGNLSCDDDTMEVCTEDSEALTSNNKDKNSLENHKIVPDKEVPDDESENEAEIMELDDGASIDDDNENSNMVDGELTNHSTIISDTEEDDNKTITNGTENSLNVDDDEDVEDDDDDVMEVSNPLETSVKQNEKQNNKSELNDSGDVVVIEGDSERKENGETCSSPEVEEVINISDKDSEVVSLVTPVKKKARKSIELSGPPRRSSRNLNKQKSYIEKEDKEEDPDVEEVTPQDPLADPLRDDKENNKKPIKHSISHTGSTIVVNDTKRLVEIAANSKTTNSSGKKEPTLVIIDTNSILSGRGPVPVSVSHKPASITTSFSMMPVALPAQGVYPPNMRATITPIPMPSAQPKPTPPAQQPTPILPTLTDDMFVVEAPSFIVPYVYEKPPVKPFKDFIAQIAKEIEENKKKDEEKKADLKSDDSKSKDDDSDHESKSDEKKKDGNESMDVDSDKEDAKSKDSKSSDEPDKKDTNKDDIKTIDLDEIPDDSSTKPKSNSYFDNPLGQFFINIGFNLVQEYVQTDLLKQQKRKNSREGNTSIDTKIAISSLIKNLEYSKENNEPFKLEQKKCEFCSFKTESNLVMAHHLETPHMRNYVYKCNFCPLEVRSPHDILFHMEAEHNIRGRLERAPAFHQCPNCSFEDNQKGKLSRHLVTCLKKFKPERNLDPPHDWEPPAKIPRVPRVKQTGLSATAATYQALAVAQSKNNYQMFSKIQQPQSAQSAFQRGRGRPSLMGKINSIRTTSPIIRTNTGMMYRPGTSGGSVLIPTSYQFGGNQIFQVCYFYF